MSEETDLIPEGQENTQELHEPSEAEVRARAQGWVPKEEWQGTGKWRDAEDFLDRGELFQKIDSYRREALELRQAQSDFAKHLQTVRDTEFKRALDQLRTAKKEALIEGDADAVIEIDEKIAEARAEAAKADFSKQAQPNQPHPEFVAWVNQNNWYQNDPIMRGAADAIGLELAQRGMSPHEVLKEVATRVRKEFPHKFENPNRARASAVEGSSPKVGKSKEEYPLTDEQKQVMHRLVKSGALTKEQYIADLKAADSRGIR